VKKGISLLAFATSLAVALSTIPGTQATAQSRSETFAIKNARIVTVTGPTIENGTVVVSGGKITAVGASPSVPSGAKVIDGAGLSVYPGMVDSGTQIGLTEIGSVAGSIDTSEIGDNNANLHVDVSINPDSSHIAVTRVNGITTVLTAPRGGLISGQSALINLDGWVPRDMVLKAPAAMHINWPGGFGGGAEFSFARQQQRSVTQMRREQEKQIENLKKILEDARAYAEAKDARAKDSTLPRRAEDLKLDALIPVVRGQEPVVINANLERDIRKAVQFCDEMKIKMILSGGVEAYKVAGLLKAKGIPVLVGPIYRLPGNEDDPYDSAFANAGLLSKAGVKVAFATQSSAEARDLPYQAGIASAFGLPKEEALKAVTIYPAEIFGVADKIGSIEQGKIANLIVTDGDPLEVRTQIKHLFINGHEVPLTSRHTELYERYKARP
jgi:imidazolonepropionase-like amidohydrolase